MALATIATLATIAAAGTSMYATYEASKQTVPTVNGASSSRKVAQAQALALPTQLQLQQLMQQGGKGMVDMPEHVEQQKFYNVPVGSKYDFKGENNVAGMATMGVDPVAGTIMATTGSHKKRTVWQLVPASEWEEGGSRYGQTLPPESWSSMQEVTVPAGPQELDFTGYGTADILGNQAERMAQMEIDLGKKYGVEFATQARELAEQSDPLGTQARNLESELINKDMAISPLSGQVDQQVQGQVAAGRGLDNMSRDLLDKAVAQANASRGGDAAAGDVATSMSTGAEGQRRLEDTLKKSMSFMSSGQTPEDIQYQRDRQKNANLGAFVNGQTPQSQFSNIARANQGATPVTGAQTNATMPNNAGSVGSSYANTVNATNANTAANGTNNWFAGLSSLLSGIGSLKTAKG